MCSHTNAQKTQPLKKKIEDQLLISNHNSCYNSCYNYTNIPYSYKCNSKQNRLKLLIGIIDRCGHNNQGYYIITHVNKTLSYDILFIARSLGLVAYIKEYRKNNIYYKVYIQHNDIHNVKVLNEENNIVLCDVFITSIGIDDYYGFEINGNHKYVLENFIVTHNTIISMKMI